MAPNIKTRLARFFIQYFEMGTLKRALLLRKVRGGSEGVVVDILGGSFLNIQYPYKQGVSSHGKPGKVMEIGSSFWKIHKRSWKFKGIRSQNGVVPFFHPPFQYKDTFM